jgi:hypothetical protein
MLAHPDFVDGTMTTQFFETHFSKSLDEPAITGEDLKLAEDLYRRTGEAKSEDDRRQPNPWFHSWSG